MVTRKKRRRRKTAKKRSKRRVKRRVGTRRVTRKKKRKATPKQMAALRKAWAARGIRPGRKTAKKATAATKKANGKKITRMKNDGVISNSVAEHMRAANRKGSMPMIRYIKTGDQAGVDFAGEFIGPRQAPRFIGPIHQPGKAKKPKHYATHVSDFYD